MHKIVVAVVFALMAGSTSAQQACPCVPVTHVWIAVACESWDCAVTNVIAANGRPDAVPIPTSSSDFTWVVLRRIVSGGAAVSPDAPFRVDGFDSLPVAMAQFSAIDSNLQPVLFTAPDGKILVLSRRAPEPRRHASGR